MNFRFTNTNNRSTIDFKVDDMLKFTKEFSADGEWVKKYNAVANAHGNCFKILTDRIEEVYELEFEYFY